jgi:hypothetical protein
MLGNSGGLLMKTASSGISNVTPPRKSYLAKLLLVGASLLVTFVFLEVGLRAAGIVYGGSFYQGDLVRGWSFRPGAHAWAVAEGKEYVRINSDGFRDREHAIQKPPDTVRIAVLGDSYVEAMNVPSENAFPSLIERELSHCAAIGNRKVEVFNFGVSGYGTAHELLTLRERVWKYNPDIILLAFYTGNDFFNNYRPLNIFDTDQGPYFVYRGDELVVDNSFRNSWKFSKPYLWFFNFRGDLRNHSRVLQLLAKTVDDLRIKGAKATAGKAAAGRGVSDLEDMIYSSPADAGMKEAWHVTEGLLLIMRDEVRSHGAELWLTTLANRPQLNPDTSQRQAFMNRLHIDTPFYPDLRLRAFAQQAGIPAITLAPIMSEHAETHHVFLNGGRVVPLGVGHWNEKGHELAGGLIASELCSHSEKISVSAGSHAFAGKIAHLTIANSAAQNGSGR